MDIVSPALATRSTEPEGPVLARVLTPAEWSHLERLRTWLRTDGVDGHDPAALDARWTRLLGATGDAPAPEGVAAAIGIAVGDLLVSTVPGALWMMCPGPEGATPGVLHEQRPHMPVLPVLDAQARRRARVPAWTVDYVARATAHLLAAAPGVPTPHRSPEQPTARHGAHALPDAPLDHPSPDDAAWAAAVTALTEPTVPRHAGQDEDPAAFFVTPDRAPDAGDAAPGASEPTPAQGDLGSVDPGAPGLAAHDAAALAGTTGIGTHDAAAHGVELDGAPAAPVDPSPDAAALPADDLDAPTNPTPTVAPPATQAVAPAVTPVAGDAYVPRAFAVATPGLGSPVAAARPLTPDDLPHRPSERVQDLALRALELALERAVRGDAAPFVLVREGYDVEVLDFEASDAGVAEAREAARRGGYSAAAVSWTSPADATRPHPRVVVDASSAGRPGIRVAHAFAQDELGSREVGGPEVVGQSAPVL